MSYRFYRNITSAFIFSSLIFSQNMPSWIVDMPKDISYYWARESIEKKGLAEDDYKEKVNNRAIKTLSMQINARIASSTESNLNETNFTVQSEFSQSLSMSTMSDIDGAEKYADFDDGQKYWVIWRLNKETHEKNIQRAAESAKGYYEFFLTFSDQEPVQQLQQLIPAYEDIMKVIGKDIIFNGTKNLKTEIPNQLMRILNKVRILSDGETNLVGKVNASVSKPLKVKTKAPRGYQISDIPIIFSFENGEGEFSHEKITTPKSGKVETKITKIFSRRRVQSVRAQIDLSQYRENILKESPFFDKHLREITMGNSVLFTIDVSEVTQQKIAVITVGDTATFDERDLKRINRSIRSEFVDVTEFKLKDESLVDGIIDNYKRSANLCSDEECQIQIGKKLGVEQLIFIDINDYPLETAITVFLRDIIENELVMEYTYSFDHSKNASIEDKINIILENGPYMVEDFWYRMNPGYLTLNALGVRGVKGEFKFLDPTEWMDSKFEKRFPLTQEKFYEGEYELNINKLGYEKFHTRFEVSMGDYPEFDIDLKRKTAFKAFMKSLFIPGRGQIYASDVDHKGRKIAGLTYFSLTVLGIAGSGYTWDQYYGSKDNYEISKDEYNQAIQLNDITNKRDIMTKNFNSMSNKKNIAMALTGLTAGMWIFNAIDAAIFFPSKYKNRRLSFKIESSNYGNFANAGTKIGINYKL